MPPLRREFVERKLQLIADDLGRLAEFRDVSLEDLVRDEIRLAAVERLLERIVLRGIDVNEHLIGALATGEEARTTRLSYRETFQRLADLGVYSREFAERIGASAGLRNILVHEYNDIDHHIVHASIRTALEDYASYVECIHDFVTAH
jgi:uncharacterized protein YutE (UPF0331/DUF86 family)